MRSKINDNTTVYLVCLQDTPLGPISLAATDIGLAAIDFGLEINKKKLDHVDYVLNENHPVLQQGLQQIKAYFGSQRRIFDLPIDWTFFSTFEKSALQEVMRIPYGEIKTYGEVAALLGKPKASRAVGGANARNLIPIVIPCHRVVNSQMKLHGYSASVGLEGKAWLLQLEGHQLAGQKILRQ
ncbi:MAG: methylated-DNA--[protein]-cysteine S-methyltransferase [Anaerolineaceae bacterium]|nr:methylated-DNA--[protein]-cysteine S-methyltransferase [Anaerolineaceae bacterium]